MSRIFLLSSIAFFGPLSVYAQAQEETFFDKYIPIAKLFDSPIFFWSVIGSALGLFFTTLIFLQYVKRLERRVIEWGEKQSPNKLVELLDSPIPQEKRFAFMYLRKHGGEEAINALTNHLQAKRKDGKLSPDYIYLLEDLNAEKAIPILKQIADSKSRLASLAQKAAERIMENCEEEAKDQKPAKAKS